MGCEHKPMPMGEKKKRVQRRKRRGDAERGVRMIAAQEQEKEGKPKTVIYAV